MNFVVQCSWKDVSILIGTFDSRAEAEAWIKKEKPTAPLDIAFEVRAIISPQASVHWIKE
jgi:hypothetical protein